MILASLFLAAAAASAPAGTVELRILAINDFHGRLSSEMIRDGDNAAWVGGALGLAANIRRLRAAGPHSLLVSSGDLIGASELTSALAHDEPTLKLFDMLGLQANAIGNHELDAGVAELRRQQSLVRFPFLSANLVDARTNQPVFAPYRIVEVDGVKLAFVGATVRDALGPLPPRLSANLRLDDEADAINEQVALLRAQGLRAIIVLLHEGAKPDGEVSEADCAGLTGRGRDIARRIDGEVDLVISAHSHQAYACKLDGRWLTQAGANGRYLTVADLEIDRRSGDARVNSVHNVAVGSSAPEVPELPVAALVEDAVARARPTLVEPIAVLKDERVSAAPDGQGGSPLGRLVARAQLAAAKAQGAELACTNPSSVPTDLQAPSWNHVATYESVRAAQPYGNVLEVREVTGAQLRALLDQQWRKSPPALLSCSPRVDYRVEGSGEASRLVPGSLRIGTHAIGESEKLRLVANGYLARGGQGFDALLATPQVGEAGVDYDALLAWLRAQPRSAADARALKLALVPPTDMCGCEPIEAGKVEPTRQRAAKGDSKAAYELHMHYLGAGNRSESEYWLRMAAEQEDCTALLEYADVIHRRDAGMAADWLDRGRRHACDADASWAERAAQLQESIDAALLEPPRRRN